ncbi:hypothetical protein M9Y10_007094 [Tritrichomonas musculus]|uniref:Uncharacterized protein n=1 Tax=Tritrichomonas musculus TaxID=1915356 RepID=A0ABR2J0S1_9EUKA
MMELRFSYSLAADQNHPDALYNLGLIFDEDEEVPKDINKVIHYYTLAAEQNNPLAQFNLGLIYHDGEYILKDVKKAIHYYSLAADQNISQAQYNLGVIYNKGEYVQRDIKKAIHYYLLAANKNHPEAQFIIGTLYYEGIYFKQYINVAIRYFTLSAKRNYIRSHFVLGVIYSQGIQIERNIEEAIYHYKNGSNLRDSYSKNNLGIIYKDEKYKNNSKEYFGESIQQKNDRVSMYNLGHIYFYGEKVKQNIERAIELFINSSLHRFKPSTILLSLAIVKKINKKLITKEIIDTEMHKYKFENINLLTEIYDIIQNLILENETLYNELYVKYKKIDFSYDIYCQPIETTDFYSSQERENEKNKLKNKHSREINKYFYEGLGFEFS